jgi:hypothetical protein
MRPGREANHSPLSSAEVKNAWSYTCTPPIRLHGVVLISSTRDSLPMLLYFVMHFPNKYKCTCRLCSSGLRRRVFLVVTDVSDERMTSISRATITKHRIDGICTPTLHWGFEPCTSHVWVRQFTPLGITTTQADRSHAYQFWKQEPLNYNWDNLIQFPCWVHMSAVPYVNWHLGELALDLDWLKILTGCNWMVFCRSDK